MSPERYAKARAGALTNREFENAIRRDALVGFIVVLLIALWYLA